LETLKTRVTESQKRWQEAQQKLTGAQQEFQIAQVEFANWQGVLQAEMRRLGQLAPLPQAVQPQPRIFPNNAVRVTPAQPLAVNSAPLPAPQPQVSVEESAQTSEVNKTELIREVLRLHPAGMTPKEIRTALKGEVSRDYIYSVLKRLKDRDQILFQRKKRKYFMRVPQKAEEPKQPVLQ
jgi:hypothetical protein